MRAALLLLALLAGGLSAGPLHAQVEAKRRADAAGLTAREVFEAVRASVVIVDAESPAGKRQGSGVVTRNQYGTAPDGSQQPDTSWIITNAHVVNGATNISIRWQGKPRPALLAYVDEAFDLALLHVAQFPLPPLAYDPRRPVGTGQRVFAVGSPAGTETSVTEGRVTGMRRINGIQAIQATLRLAPGHSGGGLFDDQGRLVGITASKAAEQDGVGFSISMAHVFDMERAYARTGAVQTRLEPLLGIAAVRSAGVNADKATFTDNIVTWQPASEPTARYRLDLRAKSLLYQSDSTNTFASGNCRQTAAR